MDIALTNRGLIEIDQDMRTSRQGVFAAGDSVTGPFIAIEAVAGGIKAAESIEQYLEGKLK